GDFPVHNHRRGDVQNLDRGIGARRGAAARAVFSLERQADVLPGAVVRAEVLPVLGVEDDPARGVGDVHFQIDIGLDDVVDARGQMPRAGPLERAVPFLAVESSRLHFARHDGGENIRLIDQRLFHAFEITCPKVVERPFDRIRETKSENKETAEKYARSESHRSSLSEYPTPRCVTIGSTSGVTAFNLMRMFLICASTVRSMLASGTSQARSIS